MKFSIKHFFSKGIFTKEILNGKLHFLCSDLGAISQSERLKKVGENEMKSCTQRNFPRLSDIPDLLFKTSGEEPKKL